MSQHEKNQAYQQALALAESGQHQQALNQLFRHLSVNPNDGEALNDAGTILFVMNRGQEAIEYLEKAKKVSSGPLLSQVLWNLCEAYIQEGRPAEASMLFDQMEEAGVLNIDVLNRTANVFLGRDALGGAMECLIRSLESIAEQEVLEPIVQIIRSKRPQVAIVADSDSPMFRMIYEFLNKRFVVQMAVGQMDYVPMGQVETVIVVGAGQTLKRLAAYKSGRKLAVILNSRDVYREGLEAIEWGNCDAVLVSGTTAQMDVLAEQVPGIQKQTKVQLAGFGLDTGEWTFVNRCKGKRLAAVGPFSTYNNPQYLILCMQKLNYLDRDWRLYLAGEFEDKAIERHCRQLTAKLNLEGAVFFDSRTNNLNAWLKDKSFIVSSSITPACFESVWAGMACGLKPIVQYFPGAEECVEQDYLFTIAEDFCKLAQSEDYQPQRYRQWVTRQNKDNNFLQKLNAAIMKIERQISLNTQQKQQQNHNPAAVEAIHLSAAGSSGGMDLTPQYSMPKPQAQSSIRFDQPSFGQQAKMPPTGGNYGQGFLSCNQTPSPIPAPRPVTFNPQPSVPANQPSSRSITEIAEEALKASQRLKELCGHSEQQSYSTPSSQEGLQYPFVR